MEAAGLLAGVHPASASVKTPFVFLLCGAYNPFASSR